MCQEQNLRKKVRYQPREKKDKVKAEIKSCSTCLELNFNVK